MNKQKLIKSTMTMIKSLLLLSCIVCASIVSAQTAPPGISDQVTIKVSPEKPRPEESVTITIENFSTNINKAYIEWSINGVIKEEGPGKNSFSFSTGKAGTVQKISVVITTEDQRVINKTITFAPAKVGLVIEADTYTPPFYKGKALFVPESSLKIVAFPNFVTDTGYRIPAENLVYTWRVDGSVVQSASGYGKSYFIKEGTILGRPFIITVDVSAYNSPLVATESIEIVPDQPEIVLYEDSLLYGIRREAGFTNGIYLPVKEIKLVAEPYFLSVHIPESIDAQYTWTLNGQYVTPLGRSNTIGLENRSGESGRAELGVSIEHLKKLLQSPSLSTQIEFGATQ